MRCRFPVASVLLLLTACSNDNPAEPAAPGDGRTPPAVTYNWFPMRMNVTEGASLRAVWGSAPDNVYAVGDHGVIVSYDGTDWHRDNNVPSPDNLTDIWGAGASDIWAVGEQGTLLHFDGAAWTFEDAGTAGDFHEISPGINGDAYAIGDDATLRHYTSGTWETIELPAGHDGKSVWVAPDGTIYALTEGADLDAVVWQSSGSNWLPVPETGSYPPDDVAASDHIHGLQDGELLLKLGRCGPGPCGGRSCSSIFLGFDGAQWDPVPVCRTTCLPRPGAQGHFFDLGDNVYATGDRGIVRFDGMEWSTIEYSGPSPYHDVWGASPDALVAVGDDGQIMHYDGHDWQSARNASAYPLNAIWGTDRNNVYAVGFREIIMHFDGNQWTAASQFPGAATPEFNYSLRDIWGRSENEIYAVSNQGAMYSFDGTTWTRDVIASVPYRQSLEAITGSDRVAIAVGRGGLAVRHDENGWSSLGNTGADLYDVAMFDEDHAIAVGTVASDGGTGVVMALGPDGEWHTMKTPTDNPLVGIASAFGETIAVGWNVILRLTSTGWRVHQKIDFSAALPAADATSRCSWVLSLSDVVALPTGEFLVSMNVGGRGYLLRAVEGGLSRARRVDGLPGPAPAVMQDGSMFSTTGFDGPSWQIWERIP